MHRPRSRSVKTKSSSAALFHPCDDGALRRTKFVARCCVSLDRVRRRKYYELIMQGRIKVVVDDCNSAYQYGDYGDIPASISGTRITGYLFSPGGCEQPDASHILTIAPVRLVRNQRSYLLREPFVIDLRAVAPDQYQVHLVQDFWTDDDDPDLTACLASIFLGR